MRIPLYAKNIEVEGATKIEIWNDKQKSVVDIPMRPYLYSKVRRNDIFGADESREVVKYISDLKEREVYKYTFDSVKQIPEYRDDDSMEADIPFVQRVAIDAPKFFPKYPQKKSLDILYFDIEVDTIGIFPKSDTNPIIGIGYAFNDEKPVILLANSLEEGDLPILTQFMDVIKEKDPDLITTFFGNVFDIPYVIDRLMVHGISTSAFTRADSEAYFTTDEDEKIIYIKGRCLFDIFEEVIKDQSLFGISDRKMKTVAKWFDLQNVIRKQDGFEDYDVVTEDLSNLRKLINTKQLYDYLMSDVLITRELSNIYLPNVIVFAEMVGLPLNITIGRRSSMPHTVLSARNLKTMNVISDAPNFKRYPDIFGEPVEVEKRGKKKTEFVGGTRFQGAVVGCNPLHQRKVVKKLKHRDFRSLYPSIIMFFNISPETVFFQRYEDYVKDYFGVEDFLDYRVLTFSDDRLEKNVVVKILKKEGFATREMKRFFDARVKIKEEIERTTDQGKLSQLNSASVIYKILLNSYFGCTGSGFFRYSTVYQAMSITAVGRYLIRWVMEQFGDSWVIVDTDGCYGMKDLDEEAITAAVNKMLYGRFRVKSDFVLEGDVYESGYALRMKNYVLMKKGKLIKHGVSFKASSKNLIFSETLDRIAVSVLTDGDTLSIARECYAIEKRDFSEFVMRTNINREKEDYSHQPFAGKKGCVQVQVANQVEDFHGNPVRVGDSISYVKTILGYEIRETAEMKHGNIDLQYYRKQVLSVMEKFNLQDVIWNLKNPNQTFLEAFV